MKVYYTTQDECIVNRDDRKYVSLKDYSTIFTNFFISGNMNEKVQLNKQISTK